MIQLRNMPTKKGLSFYLYAGLGRKSWGRTYCGMRKICRISSFVIGTCVKKTCRSPIRESKSNELWRVVQ